MEVSRQVLPIVHAIQGLSHLSPKWIDLATFMGLCLHELKPPAQVGAIIRDNVLTNRNRRNVCGAAEGICTKGCESWAGVAKVSLDNTYRSKHSGSG